MFTGIVPRFARRFKGGQKRKSGGTGVPPLHRSVCGCVYFNVENQAFLLLHSLLPSESHMPKPVTAQMMEKMGTMKMNQQ